MVLQVLSQEKLLSLRLRPRVEQALNLIGRGKEFVALRDPALKVITQTLLLKGATSAEAIGRALVERRQEEVRQATFERVTGIKPTDEPPPSQIDTGRVVRVFGTQARIVGGIPPVQQVAPPIGVRVPTGIGTITRAIDVGDQQMQDFLIRFSRGQIISSTPLGKPIPQTKRFRETALEKKFTISENLKKFLAKERAIPATRETIQIRTPAEERRFIREQFGRPETLRRGLEKVEVALFPALVGRKFLDSQLGAKLTSGNIQQADRETANKVRELLPKTAGVGIEARKSSLELLQLIRRTDTDIQRDLREAERVGRTFERFGARFDTINLDLSDEKISEETAINRQNELLNKFNARGFIVEKKNGSVDISHPVYDRLGGFTTSAWANILKQARKGDSPIKDQALIGTLDFLNKAYEAEKIVLAFELAGKAGLKFPRVTGTPKQLKIFNTISKLSGGTLIGTFGAARGVQQLAVTGEPLLGITSAAGTVAGFLAPSGLVRLNNQLKKLNDAIKGRTPIAQTKAAKKALTKQVQVQKKAEKTRKKVRLQLTRKEARIRFGNSPRSKQIEIIERIFRGKQVTNSDLIIAKRFMKESGLAGFQIDDRLAEALRRIQLSSVRESARLGIITQQQARQQIKVLRDAKSQILKLAKEKTIVAPKLTSLQIERQKSLITRIAQTQAQLDRGFLAPLQENILRNELLSLKAALDLLGKKEIISIPSPFTLRINLIQKQLQEVKKEQEVLRFNLQKESSSSGKASIQKEIQRQQQKEIQLQKQITIQRQGQTQRISQQTQQQLRLLIIQQTQQQQRQDSLTRQLQLSTNATRQQQLQQQITKQKQLQKQIAKQIKGVKSKLTKLPIPILPSPFFENGKKRRLRRRELLLKNAGYNAFAKQKGLFRKLNKVPISKKKAKDLAAWAVDNSTSARGKIIRVLGKKAQKSFKRIPQNYFMRTSKKYRGFKIIQGKKVKLKNEFIERKKHRIDTIGEKRGLSAARAVAKLKTRKTIKPFKNKTRLKSTSMFKINKFKSNNPIKSIKPIKFKLIKFKLRRKK